MPTIDTQDIRLIVEIAIAVFTLVAAVAAAVAAGAARDSAKSSAADLDAERRDRKLQHLYSIHAHLVELRESFSTGSREWQRTFWIGRGQMLTAGVRLEQGVDFLNKVIAHRPDSEIREHLSLAIREIEDAITATAKESRQESSG